MTAHPMFDPEKHIRNVTDGEVVSLLSADDTILPGITGVAGAQEVIDSDLEIGIDRIVMEPGAEFDLHTHPGAHILYVVRSHGYIHIDGSDYAMAEGDTVYVPANYPHGVKTDPTTDENLEILAFGVPHMPIDSPHRMTLVTDVAGVPERPVSDEHALLEAISGLAARAVGSATPLSDPDVPFVDLGFDSLALVRLLVYVETDLSIELGADLVNERTFCSLRSLTDAVWSQLSAAS